MREALRLAARARGRTRPNPMVGAVLVAAGRRVTTGYHARAGGPHAEALALARAGERTRGATLYLTLEPCTHRGRTEPCIDGVLAAGLTRVVVAMRDPDPRVSGRGLRRLRAAGLSVQVGVLEAEARELNRGYLSRLERGRPFTELKLAASLDGRIATASGESRWISGPASRAFVHRLRRRTDAIIVGSGTVRADDPELTARVGARVVHRPLRIVVDSRLVTPPQARLVGTRDPERAWLLSTRAALPRRRAALERAGARVLPVRRRAGRVDLEAAWARLADEGVNDVLVEGGAGLAAALLRRRLVDRSYLILSLRLIGGDGRAVLDGLGVRRLSQALEPRRTALRRLGPDLCLVGEW